MIHSLALIGFGFSGPWELLIIMAVFLLLFGNRIPGVARSLGRGIVEFRKGLKGEDDEEGGETRKLEGGAKKELEGDKASSEED